MQILFVCLGNICRSPTAEAIARSMRPEIRFDSAGTGDWHVGNPPYAPMQAAALARGYDLSSLRARQITRADFTRFDHVVAMDAANLADMESMSNGGARLSRLLDHVPDSDIADVPDPYFTHDFDTALTIIETGVAGLLRHI